MQTKHFTPTAAELQPFYKIKCQQPNCDSVFMNMGNYELHLQKRHHVSKTSKSAECCYYCPDEECVYNSQKGFGGRHFKHIKNLRQHFQKVHSKNFICERCGDAFPTDGQLTKHSTKSCGKRLKCSTCNWDFKSIEALLTHGKRKGHAVNTAKASKLSKTQKRTTLKASDKQTQTTFENAIITDMVHHNDTQTQTEALSSDFTIIDDINAIQHDIETQTELTLQHSPLANSNSGGALFEHILTQTSAPSGADMHTQTCEAYLLSALGLSDIQTQTNWSSFEDHKHDMYTNTASTSTSTAGFACDELLVSTETQTSFTQCLLESTDMNSGCIFCRGAYMCS